eukprot:TRINITY_DN1987_c0_g1_i1.p1 TRINITY_DN1987_c0_g1~~TRINITY_DN1987_c0_g1_i1.p1  ORF type:complete len:208 (-),score=27.66 TRINITY_DN1987_c0_g1_i1:119-742(-)
MALVCAHRPLPLLLASLLVLSSLLVLASLPSLVVAVAVAKPTKAQVKAEAMKAAEYIGKTYPEYANYTKYVKQYSGLIFNSKFNISCLANCTALLPSIAEIDPLVARVPRKASSLNKVYNVSAFHLIEGKMGIAALRALPAKKALATQLHKALVKFSAKNAQAVTFGRPGSASATWTKVILPKMYVGPYFVVHGVDKVLFPPGIKGK